MIKLYAFALVTVAVILLVGFVSHASVGIFVVSGLIWAAGVYIEARQVKGGGPDDTTLFPYGLQAAGVAMMFIWQGFFA